MKQNGYKKLDVKGVGTFVVERVSATGSEIFAHMSSTGKKQYICDGYHQEKAKRNKIPNENKVFPIPLIYGGIKANVWEMSHE